MILLPVILPPARGEVPTGLTFVAMSRRLHLRAVLNVVKWRISGTFGGRVNLDPAPEDPPYTEAITSSVTVDAELLGAFSEMSDREVAEEIIMGLGTIQWQGIAESGGVEVNAIVTATLSEDFYEASAPGEAYCYLGISILSGAADGGNTSINAESGGPASIELTAFGEVATLEAKSYDNEAFGEPTVPAPAGVALTALEYRAWGGKFNPATGGPVVA